MLSTAAETAMIYLSSFNPATASIMSLETTFGHSSIHSWIAEPQLNYKSAIGKRGELNGLLGSSYQNEIIMHKMQNAKGFKVIEDMNDISKANQSTIIPTEQQSEYEYAAVFGRLKYDFDHRYLFNISGRIDASSRFGIDNRVAKFMSVGAAWIFSGENFMRENLDFLNFGKLRMSYGSSGSDQIPNYGFLDGYSATGTRYQGVNAIIPSRPANNNFKWEVNHKLEFALEFELFKKRVSGSAVYFRNRSSNLLVGLPLPPTTGFPSVQYTCLRW